MDLPDHEAILHTSNSWNIDFPHQLLLHELFETQAKQTPNSPAVVFQNHRLTYSDLSHRSNRLASSLQELGVGSEMPVVIYMERSPELIVAIFAVLKAGGVCVPFDPAYPQTQLDFVLEDNRAPVILTQQRFSDRLLEKKLNVFALKNASDGYWSGTNSGLSANDITSENLAFIFYTSGSTGTPKGVMLSHRAIHSHTFWRKAVYNFTSVDRHLLKCPVGFAFLLTETFTPLLTGGTILIAQPEEHQDAEYLIKLIAQHQISVVNFVPSQIRLILEQENAEDCDCIRHWVTGGEALATWLQRKFFARLHGSLSIIYGATEARSSTFWMCRKNEDRAFVPIGRPAPNKQIYVLDDQLDPVPTGVAGELFVAGEGLARGYLNRPDLTAEKFLPNPFSDKPGGRFYRTGDFGRYLSDGTLEFLGRKDQQVKIRGFRIELGHVEAALTQHPGVREAVVIANEARDKTRLTCYVIANPEHRLSSKDLRSWLMKKLPGYMMPSVIQFLKEWPLTPNGKIDHQALSTASAKSEREFVGPRNQKEQLLVDIWQKILELDEISVHDNFFELGGDSLMATQVLSRIRQVLQVDLPFKTFFEKATVAELATVLE